MISKFSEKFKLLMEELIGTIDSNFPTFDEIRQKHSDKEHKHHLRLVCVKCNGQETCRCSQPKTTYKGICYDCSIKKDK